MMTCQPSFRAPELLGPAVRICTFLGEALQLFSGAVAAALVPFTGLLQSSNARGAARLVWL